MALNASDKPCRPAGLTGKLWRQTNGTVYGAAEGTRSMLLQCGDTSGLFDIGECDHFLISPWHPTQLASPARYGLFSFSDCSVHPALGIHQEERLS